MLISFPVHTASQQALHQRSHLMEAHREAGLPGIRAMWDRHWDKRYLITYDQSPDGSADKPTVVLYDENGRIAREGIVWFKDAESSIVDVAVSSTGALIVAGGTQNRDGVIANFIASIGEKNKITETIRTTPFLPVHVCAAEDGTVWSYGVDRDERGERVADSPILRQYSFENGQRKAMLRPSELNAGGWVLPDGRYPGDITLRCTSRKVALLNGASSEYIEFDIPTGVLKIRKLTPLPTSKEVRITGFALTESGDVFVSLHDRTSSPPRSGLFKLTLDSSGTGSWVPVENTVGPYLHGGPIERLLGADGDDLVYTVDQNGRTRWSSYK